MLINSPFRFNFRDSQLLCPGALRMINRTLPLIAAVLLLASGQATADILTFQEVADTETGYQTSVVRLRTPNTDPEPPSSNLQIGRTANEGDFFRGLLGYDISAIPAGSTITSVTLTLTHRRADTGSSRSEDVQYELHQLTGNFVETEASWANR